MDYSKIGALCLILYEREIELIESESLVLSFLLPYYISKI